MSVLVERLLNTEADYSPAKSFPIMKNLSGLIYISLKINYEASQSNIIIFVFGTLFLHVIHFKLEHLES